MGLIPEGAKKNFKGRKYILRDHRWRRATDGQDLKTKFKPLNIEHEETLIDKATSEARLQHLARRYEEISQHADYLGLKGDAEDHDWLHNRTNDKLSEIEDSEVSDDFGGPPEKDPFWREYADRHEVTRTDRGHLQIRRAPKTFDSKKGGTITLSGRTRTIGTNRYTGEFLVSDSAQTRTVRDASGKIIEEEVYAPAEVHPGSPVLQRYLRRFGAPKTGLKIYDVLRLGDRGSNLAFAAPRRNSLADTQLPFQQAIDYFAEKTNLDTDSWIEGQGIIQQAAFTVAGAKGALLQDIRTATAKAINQGISIAEFAKEFNKIADRYSANWELKGDRAWRGQLIYEQNLRQAYAAGRYAQMTDPETLRRRPYWQWKHGDSRNPRPVHLALDGKVFPADSLPWHVPLGFGCKCQIFSLSQRDIDRENLTVETLTPGQDINYTDPKTGQTRPIKLEPDKGFEWKPDRNLTPQRRAEILQNLVPELRRQALHESLWQPLMTEAEASEYTKDSYYADQNFYYGTSAKAAQGIITKGAKLTSNVVNTYGDGFYLAFDKDTAADYAQQTSKPTVLATKVFAQNPKKFQDSIEVENWLLDNNIPADDSQSQAMTRLLKRQGFDAVEIGGNQILVIIFNKQQLAIFNSEEV
jgi:Phage Mu protein F like protein